MIRIAKSLPPTYLMDRPQPPNLLRSTDIALAYLLLRVVVGVNYFNHGITRIDDIPGFATSMVKAMEGAWMPEFLVRLTAIFVPPVELLVGLLLIAGLFTRASLIVTFILMVILMYGVTIVQNWRAASSQLIYNIVLFILLAGRGFNHVSVDRLLASRTGTR